MGVISWLIVGLIAGWLAGIVLKGRGKGVLGDIILGIIGALMGGFLTVTLFDVGDPMIRFDPPTLLIAFLGALAVVLIVRALPGRSPL